MSMSAPTMKPNHTIFISSALAMPPPTKPATKGLMGIATKWTAGMGMATSMMANAVSTPLNMVLSFWLVVARAAVGELSIFSGWYSR